MIVQSKLFPSEQNSSPMKSKMFPSEEQHSPMELELVKNQQQMPLPSWLDKTASGVIGAGDAVRNLLSLGYAEPYTKKHPEEAGTAYDVGHLLGNIGGFIGGGSLANTGRAALEHAPQIGQAARWLGQEGLGGLARRLGGSTAFETAQHPGERLRGAKEGFEGGLLGEALGVPFRMLGGLAEKVNPLAAARRHQEEIARQAQAAHHRMQDAYAPVHREYDASWVTPKPKEYLGVKPSDWRYFTPNVKRAYQDFIEEPNFKNLHQLQTRMGRDASATEDINIAQTLKNSRENVLDKITGFLGQDKNALNQYQKGREIGREEYYPFLSGKKLTAVSEGRVSDLTPKQLNREIKTAVQSRPTKNPFPENHHLRKVLENMTGKVNKGEAGKNLLTLAASLAGLAKGSPELAAVAGGASHFLAPHLLQLSQNPLVVNALRKYGNPALRGVTSQLTHKPLELEVNEYNRR